MLATSCWKCVLMAVASLTGITDEGKLIRYVNDEPSGNVEFRWQPSGALENRLNVAQTRVTTITPGAGGEWDRITISGGQSTIDLRREGKMVRAGQQTLTLPAGAIVYGPPPLLRVPAALYDAAKGGIQKFPALLLPDRVGEITVERLGVSGGFTRYRYGLPAAEMLVWIDGKGRLAMSYNVTDKIAFVREGHDALWQSRETELASVAGDAIDRYLRGEIRRRQIPGLSFAVVRGGKVVRSQAYGVASVEHGAPATTDTVFLLASVTKMFTATAVLLLAEDGKLQLDDPIARYLSDPPAAWRDITIRHLLTHTAGLKDRFEQEDLSPAAWQLNYTTRQLYDAAKRTPIDFAPGAGWQYSDQGYFLLGAIIEKAGGKSYRQFLKERVFDPLGMSVSGVVDQNEIMPRLASGYTIAGGKLRPNRRVSQYGIVSHFGVVSSAEDLAKYDVRKLLKPASVEAMRTPAALSGGAWPMLDYGFGCFLERFHGHRIVHHGGSTGTMWLHLPDDDLTVIVLTNLEMLAGGDASGIARHIAAEYVPDIAWRNLKPAADPDPKRTEWVKQSVQQILAGQIDGARYTAEFAAAMKPQLAVYQAGGAQLGALNSFEWLAEDEASGGRKVQRYRATYQRLPGGLFYQVTIEKDGRIAHLTSAM